MTLEEQFVATAYNEIARVEIPERLPMCRSEQLGDLPLVRSVHPRQLEIISALCGTSKGAKWETTRKVIWEQRPLRSKIYAHIDQLNQAFLDNPDTFIFPDAYSLLLWIWTFQLFSQSYCREPSDPWTKFYYRGESQDYRETQFLPTLARDPNARLERNLAVRVRRAVVDHLALRMTEKHEAVLLRTISCSQALAVAQHYGRKTPLLDVTTNPEVAVCFATSGDPDASGIGIVGYAAIPSHDHPGIRDLALIVAPYWCSRVHAQSGYFLATPPERVRSREQSLLKPIRFRRNGREKFRATWTQSHGSLGGTLDDLRHDAEGISSVIDGVLPIEVGATGRQIYEGLRQDGVFSKMTPLGREAVLSAAKCGFSNNGMRYMSIAPLLLDRLIVYAPIHMTLLITAVADQLPAVFDTMVTINRSRATIAVIDADGVLVRTDSSGQTHQYSPQELARLDAHEINKLVWELISDPDSDELPWPLNAWIADA